MLNLLLDLTRQLADGSVRLHQIARERAYLTARSLARDEVMVVVEETLLFRRPWIAPPVATVRGATLTWGDGPGAAELPITGEERRLLVVAAQNHGRLHTVRHKVQAHRVLDEGVFALPRSQVEGLWTPSNSSTSPTA